ncbi:MAG: caspase family protein [Mesorhizobium sp.]|uniref:caspase family protein n=1 Tax=Mesorhizobium sp. TaxID=1871066 RepID=UPI001215FEC0|nr:caspase family protein [Mesorhizobium sp.]TIR17123.1 MAG: caspase family protein [Mesorhizobium sp.]
MDRRALIVGIDHYDNFSPLSGCVADADSMLAVLARNEDGSVNFDCRKFTSSARDRITRPFLRARWKELFGSFTGDAVFYFAGHGGPSQLRGFLVTQDGEEDDLGLPMNEIVELANDSPARSVLIVLDCCFSGAAGNSPSLQTPGLYQATLREGVTILAASRPTQTAGEIDGHGLFTDLVLGALRGGAADVRGRVSAAAIYGYVESAFGSWAQRPLYKSHAARLDPIRLCSPKVPDKLLRELPYFFGTKDAQYRLDMSYEETNGAAEAANVETFKKFKTLQLAGLLMPKSGADLYWTAERSGSVELTALGQFYWRLVHEGLI